MNFFLQILISGIGTGCIYGLVGVGYSITYNTMNVLNFGLGMWVMAGAMLGFTAHVLWGLNIFLTLAFVIAAVFLMALLAERVSVRPFVMAGSSVWIMSTLAVGMLMLNAAQLIWGRNPLMFPSSLGDESIYFGEIGMYPQELLIIGGAMVLMVLLELFYRKTLTGKALRATAFSMDVASLMGINPMRMAGFSYALAGCLAALVGVLIAPVTLAEATMGTVLGIKAFGIAIVGGLDSAKGIFITGILFGVLEGLLSGYLYTGIRDIIAFSLVIVVLFVRPQGIFGKNVLEKV
jgi:branched-chain amino acid transport system permease protein